jgi:hypothetical protein
MPTMSASLAAALWASEGRLATPGSRSRWDPKAMPSTNAVAESFFATLRKELVIDSHSHPGRDLSSAVFVQA